MKNPVFFKSDYTYPRTNSSQADLSYGRLQYEFHGLEDPENFFKLIHVRPGVHIGVHHHPHLPIPGMDFEVCNSPISFSFLLSGACNYRVKGPGLGKNTEYKMVSGTNTVACLHDIAGDMSYNMQTPMICADLKIDRKLLNIYFRDQMDRLSPAMAGLFEPARQFYAAFPLCRQMAATVMEIINPPDYTGVTQALYYESRALNLLALQLELLTNLKEDRLLGCGATEPRGTDLDRIREAKRILVSDLKNPPTIATLARQCGINEFKLKKEFKQAFNTTIFSCLQQEKMATAWHLLKQGNISVTEAANEVGYTNISHFSAAFKRQFHINPGALKKARFLKHLPIPSEPGKVA